MDIITRQEKIEDLFIAVNDLRPLIKKNPAVKYFDRITDFFLDILSAEDRSLETSVILGAIAAKVIDKNIAEGKAEQIPELLKTLARQINDPAQIEKLENVKPNYNFKLQFRDKFMILIGALNMYTNINDIDAHTREIKEHYNNVMDEKFINDYIAAEKQFDGYFSDRKFYLRNIAKNLFIENAIPFKDCDMSLYDNYCFFASTLAAVKTNGAYRILANNDKPDMTQKEIESEFTVVTGKIVRRIAHAPLFVKGVVDLLKEYNCTSPAHLAYLLK